MDSNILASTAGVVLSLCFSYVPGLESWYSQLAGQYKRLVMLGALLLVTIGVFAMSCAGITAQVTCDQTGAKSLITLFLTAAIANQTAFMLTPKSAVG